MKKLLTLALVLLMLASCAAPEPSESASIQPERYFVHTQIKETWSDLEEYMIDVSDPEIVLERTTLLVMAEIQSADSLTYNGSCHFGYTAEIRKIYHDSAQSLKTGDSISLHSTEGIMKAADAAALIEYPLTFKGKKILTGTYGDSDYILSSQWNAVPMEVGKTYILYLSSETLQQRGYYTECGYSLLYETDGERIYTGTDRERFKSGIWREESDRTLADVEKEIEDQLAARKGYVDELGYDLYESMLYDLAEGKPPITYPCEPSRILPKIHTDSTDLAFWNSIARKHIASAAENAAQHADNPMMADYAAWDKISDLTAYPMHSYETGQICAVAYDFLDRNGKPGMMILSTDDLHPSMTARGESVVKQFYARELQNSPHIDAEGEGYLFYSVFNEGYGVLKEDGTLDLFYLQALLSDQMTEESIIRNWIFPGNAQ